MTTKEKDDQSRNWREKTPEPTSIRRKAVPEREPWSASTICNPGRRSGQRNNRKNKIPLCPQKGEWNKPLPIYLTQTLQTEYRRVKQAFVNSLTQTLQSEKNELKNRPDHQEDRAGERLSTSLSLNKVQEKRTRSPEKQTTPLQPAAKASEPETRRLQTSQKSKKPIDS